jgi:hypothetical protein
VSVRCPGGDQGLDPIRRAETSRVRFGLPRRTLLIPPEQGSDSATQTEQPFDDRGHRLVALLGR